jgi:hypothetical protein
MKTRCNSGTKPFWRILLLLALSSHLAHAASLSVGTMMQPIVPGACWDEAAGILFPSPMTSSFTLNGLGGQGTLSSSATSLFGSGGSTGILHQYQIDLSSVVQASGGQHCVSLEIYFGSTVSCDFDTNNSLDQVLVISTPVPNLGVSSATANSGVVSLNFGGASCLGPGSRTRNFGMLSELLPRVGQVTVVHTIVDGGSTTVHRYPVKALVPDIPPEISMFLAPGFQAVLKQTNSDSAFTGLVEMKMGLFNAPLAGRQVSFMFTQAVSVANGVFTSPLPFEATDFIGAGRWLELAVKPAGSNTPFTALSPRLPVSPAPQAVYAYGAASVASLKPGQAVMSLNGLTDSVLLQAGPGIQITTNGQNLIISAFIPIAPSGKQAAELGSRSSEMRIQKLEAENAELRQSLNELKELVKTLRP